MELTRLRVYMADLETHKELYYAEEEMNKNLKLQLEAYKNIVQAKDGTIITLQNWNNETQKINDNLKNTITSQNKKLKNVPYFMGGSFIGGILICLLLK